MKLEYATVQIENHLAVVTICNPPVNAMNSQAYGEIDQIFYDLGQMKDIRCVILTGECEKDLFIGGSNVKEFPLADAEAGARYTARMNRLRFDIYRFPVPVICALNGSAIGGGLGMALMCDYRITHPEAKFGVGEINMGIIGFTQFLAARVHNGVARKMVYGGIRLSAAEALRVGLLDEVVKKEDVMLRATDLASTFTKQSPIAVRRAKECMLKAESYIFDLGGQEFEDICIKELWGSVEQQESVRAFLEKRAPDFEGMEESNRGG